MEGTKKIRVLMAMPPLENHTRGLFTVSAMLRDAGMEVILLGNELPERIIDTAIQEAVDVIGISTYCGSPVVFGRDLLKIAQDKGLKKETGFIIGGIFPPKDEPALRKMGFAGVFPPGPGSTRENIVDCVKSMVSKTRGNGHKDTN